VQGARVVDVRGGVQQGASAAVALDALATSMSPACWREKGPHRQRGAPRAGLDPCAAGRSVYLGDATSPICQRSLQGEVTYQSELSEVGQSASNLSRAKSDQRSSDVASEAAFVVTCPEIPATIAIAPVTVSTSTNQRRSVSLICSLLFVVDNISRQEMVPLDREEP
jgi:hypothetical protein